MNIVLIGMMGSGKSRLGFAIAKKLCKKFIDTDRLITTNYGDISTIFAEHGEEYFRRVEKEQVFKACLHKRAVIATGGGVVLNKENMLKLKENGVVIYLKITEQTVYERTRKHKRPILEEGGMEKIKQIMLERNSLYTQYADIIIDSNSYGVDSKVKEILYKVNGYLKNKGIRL